MLSNASWALLHGRISLSLEAQSSQKFRNLDYKCYILVGFTTKQWSRYVNNKNRRERVAKVPLPNEPPAKPFKKTFSALPDMDNYREKLPQEYWDCWISRSYEDLMPFKSWVCPDRMLAVARRVRHNCYDH